MIMVVEYDGGVVIGVDLRIIIGYDSCILYFVFSRLFYDIICIRMC